MTLHERRRVELKTYIIGHSQDADIVIPDLSVAGRHAELVVTDDRRYHLTDCGSGRGTWRRVASAGNESWAEVRQAFVDADALLRIGGHRCTVATLLERRATPGRAAASAENGATPSVNLPHGRVERDPVTGEIIRKRP